MGAGCAPVGAGAGARPLLGSVQGLALGVQQLVATLARLLEYSEMQVGHKWKIQKKFNFERIEPFFKEAILSFREEEGQSIINN